MKKITLIGLLAFLLLASCMILKKKYLSGYRIFTRSGEASGSYRLAERNNPPPPKIFLSDNHPQAPIYATKDHNILLADTKAELSDNAMKSPDYIFNHDNKKSNRKQLLKISRKNQKKNSVVKQASPPGNEDPWEITGKSRQVAIILCILLGLLGIHRFYLGYTGMGCLYFLTLGLFFVGCGIDLFRLATNDLKPKINENAEVHTENVNYSNMAGSPVRYNVIAEPDVVIKDAKSGLLELNLVYISRFKQKYRGVGMLNPTHYRLINDENNDPYYNQMPAYDSVKTHRVIMERCQSLGFKKYKKFTNYRKECAERHAGSNGFCTKYKAVIDCQCTN